MSSICLDDHEKKGFRAGWEGGVEAVVEALKAHRADGGVQEQGCRALSNLCFGDENRRRAGSAGGVEAVVEALKAHSADARV